MAPPSLFDPMLCLKPNERRVGWALASGEELEFGTLHLDGVPLALRFQRFAEWLDGRRPRPRSLAIVVGNQWLSPESAPSDNLLYAALLSAVNEPYFYIEISRIKRLLGSGAFTNALAILSAARRIGAARVSTFEEACAIVCRSAIVAEGLPATPVDRHEKPVVET